MPYGSLTARISRASDTITPVKPSSPRSSPVSARRRQRRRQVAGELGHPQVARHDRAHAGGDGGRERRQVAVPQHAERRVHGGEDEMGVEPGAAVAGKVLGAGRDAGRLQPGDGGRGVPGDQRRV